MSKRKPKRISGASVELSVSVPTAMWRHVAAEADARNLSVSALARLAIAEYLEIPADAREMGVAGRPEKLSEKS